MLRNAALLAVSCALVAGSAQAKAEKYTFTFSSDQGAAYAEAPGSLTWVSSTLNGESTGTGTIPDGGDPEQVYLSSSLDSEGFDGFDQFVLGVNAGHDDDVGFYENGAANFVNSDGSYMPGTYTFAEGSYFTDFGPSGNTTGDTLTISNVTPEPGMLLLVGSGALAGFGAMRRRFVGR